MNHPWPRVGVSVWTAHSLDEGIPRLTCLKSRNTTRPYDKAAVQYGNAMYDTKHMKRISAFEEYLFDGVPETPAMAEQDMHGHALFRPRNRPILEQLPPLISTTGPQFLFSKEEQGGFKLIRKAD